MTRDSGDADAGPKPSLIRNGRVQFLVGLGVIAGFAVGLLISGRPWHLPPAWGDIPTWIEALATIGLLIGAVITARYAIKAFGKQTEQLEDQRTLNREQTKVLELQARELRESIDEREREREQRHRDQASRVFITQEAAPTVPAGYAEKEGIGPFVTATVVNTSGQPVYSTELRWHLGPGPHGEPNPDPIGAILPGGNASRMRQFPHDVDLNNSGADVTFTDASNVRWIRRPDGYLNEFRQA